jgi:hypothetical protein
LIKTPSSGLKPLTYFQRWLGLYMTENVSPS